MANSLVFQRGAGGSGQISYWAGSTLVAGGGGPVPAFVGAMQPAWVDLASAGSHTIKYAAKQPIDQQVIFFSIIPDDKKESPVGMVSFYLNQGGTLTLKDNTAGGAGVVVKNEGKYFAIMIPPTI